MSGRKKTESKDAYTSSYTLSRKADGSQDESFLFIYSLVVVAFSTMTRLPLSLSLSLSTVLRSMWFFSRYRHWLVRRFFLYRYFDLVLQKWTCLLNKWCRSFLVKMKWEKFIKVNAGRKHNTRISTATTTKLMPFSKSVGRARKRCGVRY